MQGPSTTGTWAVNGTSMVVASATGLAVGQVILAVGIPSQAQITLIAGLTVHWTPSLPASLAGTNAPVNFGIFLTVSSLYTGITDNLMGRPVPPAKMAEAIRKSALELTEDYKFSELQSVGPTVQLQTGVPNYPTSYFTLPTDGAIKINRVNSFFLFNDPLVPPISPAFTGNTGFELPFKTYDRMTTLLNVLGTPVNWSRFQNQIWIGSSPDNTYFIAMAYQHEHPFPNAGLGTAGNDFLFFPDSWQDILEYAASQRLAQIYNLSTKASELNKRLNGDAEFQSSGGISGTPGLIFQRTSDEQRDQTTTVRRFRLRMTR